MSKKSAGILLFRKRGNEWQFLLAHPGGPFWAKKDEGAWSVPKGEFGENEEALDAAIREFEEETGTRLSGNFLPLSPVKQKSGKMVYAFALEHDLDPSTVESNYTRIEWPPRSGKTLEVPEIDQAEWFDAATAKKKINPAQAAFIDELLAKIGR